MHNVEGDIMRSLSHYHKQSKEIWISTSIRDENSKTMSRWEVSFDHHIRLHTYSFYNIATTEKISKWYKISHEKINELKEALHRINFEHLDSNYYNPNMEIGTSATLAIGQKDFHELIFIDRNEDWGYLEPTRLYNLRHLIREASSDLCIGSKHANAYQPDIHSMQSPDEIEKSYSTQELIMLLVLLAGIFLLLVLIMMSSEM